MYIYIFVFCGSEVCLRFFGLCPLNDCLGLHEIHCLSALNDSSGLCEIHRQADIDDINLRIFLHSPYPLYINRGEVVWGVLDCFTSFAMTFWTEFLKGEWEFEYKFLRRWWWNIKHNLQYRNS